MKKFLSFILILLVCIAVQGEGLKNIEKTTKQQKKEKSEIKQKIKAISASECFAKYFSILTVENDGSMYRIMVSLYPLFEPKSYEQIQTWSDAVCKSSKRILDNYGLIRNISVWIVRPMQFSLEGNGYLIIYGRTFYNHHTDRYEFKSLKVLNNKKRK
ncbi:hypothetical protein ES702_03818 [subsurface metagenome]